MPRPELHPRDRILDAARTLVLERGAKETTVAAIAAASGAPKGSIYHRFASAGDLLAAMWLRAVRRAQAGLFDAMAVVDPVEAALAAGLSVERFARTETADAKLLASLRREDLVTRVSDQQLRRELEAANEELEAALAKLARRLYGRASRAAVEATACAVIDLPHGAVRRHLVGGSALPSGLQAQLEAAIGAAIAAGPSRQSHLDDDAYT